MSPFTHTCYGPTTSTETTEPDNSNYYYVTQSDFNTTTKDLLYNFDDKFKEYLKETIAYQDMKSAKDFEKHIQILSLRIKEYSTKFSLKLNDQENNTSFFTESYN